MGRTPFLIAELMPGLTTNTPIQNQVTISGGFGFDNVFLIDGVDVNDNLLGTSNDLFIEDAIGEVQVLTSGISAEFGRFSGGVDQRHHQERRQSSSPAATGRRSRARRGRARRRSSARTTSNAGNRRPRTRSSTNKLSHFSELTAGGPVVRDRLWFFGAGRFENSATAGTMPATAVAYTKTNDSKRYEGKLTGTLRPSHTLQGTVIDNRVHRANEPVLSFSIDRAALISPSTPNRLGVVNYNGALSSRMLLSAQYSQKRFATEGVGGTSTDLIDSPFLTRQRSAVPVQRPLLRRERPGTAQQPAVDRQPQLLRVEPALGQPRRSRAGSSTSSTHASARTRRARPAMCSCPTSNRWTRRAPVLDADGHPIPRFAPGVVARAALDSRIAAPSST